MTWTWMLTRRRLLLATAAVSSAFGSFWITRGQRSEAQEASDEFETIVGPADLVETQGKVLTDKVLIVRNTETNELIGVSPFCTHANCVVNWVQEEQQFICPCHASAFAADGSVVNGPAETPLISYEVQIAENRYQIRPRQS